MRAPRRLLLSMLVGLVALELILQIAAFVASFAISGPATSTSGPAPILCIGDSYTYGLGATATEHSYPGTLQRLLKARDPQAPAVVNAGWPGQNSREALLRLDAQLAQHRPRLVCVLIGLNDTWTRPDALTGDELAETDTVGFVWRFRTWRLLRLLLGRDAPTLPAQPANTPGTGGTKPPSTDSNDPAVEAVALLQSGQHDAAIVRLERAIEEEPARAPEFHQGLVQICTSLGQRERAAISLQWLREQHATSPTENTTEAYATALAAVGNRAEAAAVAVAGTATFPRSSTLWWVAGQHHYETGDLQTAESDLEAALACADPDNRDWQALVHRDLAKTCADRDPCKAIRNLLAAMRIDRDVERCRLIVEGAAEAFTQANVTRCVQELDPGAIDLELLQRLFGSGWADRTALREVLAGHLAEILRRCEASGCRVVVLGYPLAVDDVGAVQRAAAEAAKVPFVACMPTFAARLRTVAREALYIRDGHCNDAGYALMAEIALPTVLRELQRPR